MFDKRLIVKELASLTTYLRQEIEGIKTGEYTEYGFNGKTYKKQYEFTKDGVVEGLKYVEDRIEVVITAIKAVLIDKKGD